MFEQVIEAIKRHGTVIIHRHSSPDGDALGSQIGLCELIRDNFPGKTVYAVGDGAGRYSFMDGSVMDVIPDSCYENALSFVLDSATEELVSDKRFKNASESVRIDHHIYCETFTGIEIVDTSYESCCGMIAEFARESRLSVSVKAATALFTGMVTDSGRFRYSCTNARTFELAAYLTSAGIDSNAIYLDLYASELSSVLLRAEFTRKITVYKNSCVAYIYNTKEDLQRLGVTDTFFASRGMVNVMSDIRGIDIWVNFTEDGDKVLCELRSSRYNINPVAVKYGGGGHQRASGADVRDHDEAMRMLEDLRLISEAAR
ncbi:MAG: bifunctional oligoribonuclease/PAP phosphatase NrnA [Clostridia bacterium]|nr:bifunctional oligoribonuclease/PAP phosphatase NrnA [Clostridia bacterium]